MVRVAIFCAGAFLFSISPATAHTTAAGPGAGIDVASYNVTVTPDFANKTLSGSEKIELRASGGNIREIVFSPNAMTIDRATLDGAPVRVSSGKDGVVVTLPRSVGTSHPATLAIVYHGTPARGVTFAAQSVYTSYFACDWMFCTQDAPGDKAAIDITLRLPKGMTSVSAGRLVGKTVVGGDMEAHRWHASVPYSPYLYGFAAGRYAEAIDRQDGARLVYLSDVADAAKLRTLFAQTGKMVDFLSDKAGLPLPAGRYTQVLVAGDEAQEATSFSLIGVDEVTLVLDDPSADWVIVHELAHQWWGNLVTCKTWQDFWLNEGITVFMTAAWKEYEFGRAAYDAELAIARKRFEKARDAGWDRPLAFSGSYPSLGVRRAIQYSKGALFMDHLRTVLGDADFWAGLKDFTKARAGGVVVSHDFEEAMEKASGRDLSAIFASWVYGSDQAASKYRSPR